MLDLTNGGLYEECRQAESALGHYLEGYTDDIARMHGAGYPAAYGQSFSDPENHLYELQTLVGPQLTAANPQALVKSSRAGEMQEHALKHEFALNSWIRRTKMQRLNRQLRTDFLLRWAVCSVMPERWLGHGTDDDQWYQPIAKRISPRRFIWDPQALHLDESRFFGQLVVRDKEDIIAEAQEHPDRGWNLEMIDRLTPDSTEPGKARKTGERYHVDRGQVAYWELFIPEAEPEPDKVGKEGYHGGLYWIPAEGGGDEFEWLREPKAWFGPRKGPFVIFGAEIVPDETAPLAPGPAVRSQAADLNAISVAMTTSNADYKRIVLVSDADPDLATVIEEGEHHYVYTVNVDDLPRKVAQIELGGATPTQLAAYQVARARLDRASGITEAMRGNVTGQATASENLLAQGAADIRIGELIDVFRTDGIEEILERVAWFHEADESVRAPLGPEAVGRFVDPETKQPIMGPMMRGSIKDDSLEDFDALEFSIDVMSMGQRTEERQLRDVADLDFFATQIVPMIPQTPHFDWGAYMDERNRLRGRAGASRMVDLEVAAQMTQLILQGAQFGEVQPQAANQPLLKRDAARGGGFQAGGPQRGRAQGSGSEAPSRIMSRPAEPGTPTFGGASP